MPNDSTFDAHGLRKVRKEGGERLAIHSIHNQRAIEALLTLVLLLQEMVASAALHGHFATAGEANPLLCAAVGLLLGHRKREERRRSVAREGASSKEKSAKIGKMMGADGK